MSDDNLRIVARVEDQFTGPLSKLKKELGAIGDEAKKQGANWRKDWSSLSDDMGRFKGVLGGIEPILSKIGMGGFGAALSLGGAALALKNFSGSTRDLNQMAKQIGLTANQLRTLSELGGKVGVSADTMKQGVTSFAGTMFELRQRWGQAYGELRNMNLGKLAEDLVNAPNMQQGMERALDGLSKISDPQKLARVSILLFGTPDIGLVAKSLAKPAKEAIQDLQKELGTIDDATLNAAQRFEENLNKMHNRWENLKLKTLGPLLEGADKVLNEAETERKAAPSRLKQDEIRRQLDVLDESYARKQANGDEAGAAETKKKRDALAAEMQRLTDEIRKLREGGGASVSPTGFNGGGGGGGSLIQKAAWGGGGPLSAGGNPDGMDGMRSRFPVPAYGSGPLNRGGGGSPGGALGSEPPTGYTGNDGRRAARSGMTAAGKQNVASWMEFFRKPTDQGGMGYTEEQARGQIAMMQGESGLNLNPASMGDHDRSGVPHAFGTVQWSDAKGNDRFPRLRALAAEMGKDWRDRSVQQEMYRREMMGRYKGVFNRIRSSQTGEQSLWAGIVGYENPQQHGLAFGIRAPFLNRLRRDGVGGAVAGVPAGDENGNFPNGAPRALKPRSMANDPSVPGQVAGDPKAAGRKAWDDRFSAKGQNGGGPAMQMPGEAASGRGRLDIHLHGFPIGSRTNASLDGLFDGHTVTRGKSQMDMQDV